MNDYDYFQNKKKKEDKDEVKVAPLTEILLDLSKVEDSNPIFYRETTYLWVKVVPKFTDKYHIFKEQTISNLHQVKQM